MKTATCPSCNQRKHSAAVNPDGLCNECRGPVRAARITEIKAEGREARKQGKRSLMNPYEDRTWGFRAWASGWEEQNES